MDQVVEYLEVKSLLICTLMHYAWNWFHSGSRVSSSFVRDIDMIKSQ